MNILSYHYWLWKVKLATARLKRQNAKTIKEINVMRKFRADVDEHTQLVEKMEGWKK